MEFGSGADDRPAHEKSVQALNKRGQNSADNAVKPTDKKGAQDMKWTLTVAHIPASNDLLLLVGIFLNPCQFGGGGSTFTGTILLQAHCIDGGTIKRRSGKVIRKQ